MSTEQMECKHQFVRSKLGFKICKICGMSEIFANIKPVKPLNLTEEQEKELHRKIIEKFGVDFGILPSVPINGEPPKGMRKGCNPGVFIEEK